MSDESQILRAKLVGGWSAAGKSGTVSADDMDFKSGFVRNLQVPPRAPEKKKSSQTGWLFC